MKKLLIIAIAACILLCACNKTGGNATDSTAVSSEKEPVIITALTEPSVTAEVTIAETSAETTAPNVTEVTLDVGSDVDVKYEVPVLDNEEIDAIIAEQSAKILANYIPNISSIEKMGGSAEYDAKLRSLYRSENIISAVFSGSYAIYYENSEEGGDVLYTINVDPTSGKILETPDVIDYEKMLDVYKNGRFDMVPDFSSYNAAYGIYPYVSIEQIEEGLRLGVYVTNSGMYQEVLGYYINPKDAHDFLKIQLTSEE